VQRVLGGQTISYPLSVLAVQPGYGRRQIVAGGLARRGRSDVEDRADTVTLGNDAKAALTLTLPQKLPEGWRMAVRGARRCQRTLCLRPRATHGAR
jgi:hypothetical protein